MLARRSTTRWLLASCGVCLLGCSGGNKLPTVPVSGVVTYNGSPLAGAQVSFLSKAQDGHSASGMTDTQGNFTLNTYLGGTQSAAGAIPGDYKVAVQKREVAGGGGDAEPPPVSEAESSASAPSAPGGGAPTGMAGYLSGSRAAGKAVIPEIYADAEKSGLEATVKPSGNEPFKFDLKD